MKILNDNIPMGIQRLIEKINDKYGVDSTEAKIFKTGILNTYQTTIHKRGDESFVITGDIPAMWNRDSVAQIRPLLLFINEDNEIKDIIKGVITIQKKQILIDPYANAFNMSPGDVGDHCDDITEMDPMVWERKYEIDSLCYPIQLSYFYYKITGDKSIFDDNYKMVIQTIYNTFKTEQYHHERSNYSFRRIADWLLFDEPERIPFETLSNNGKGRDCGYTKMTWSGFTPSDDANKYGYFIPGNMFAVVVLKYAAEIIEKIYKDKSFSIKLIELSDEIDEGIQKYGIVDHEEFGRVYAYQVDGLGNYLILDDANVPSLMSAPYLGYCKANDEVYLNTRNMLLSKANSNYYEGTYAKGIGSSHTFPDYIWHIALNMQGLTSIDDTEREEILNMLLNTHADTYMMHEGFNVNDPKEFTRPWFSWSNSMYAEYLLDLNGIRVIDLVNNSEH